MHFDREKLEFVGLDDVRLKQLKDTYPDVDVEAELKKMALWLTSSSPGKDIKGTIGFITNWLSRNTPKKVQPSTPEKEEDTPLRPYIDEYLKDLWKGREHILELNRISKKK